MDGKTDEQTERRTDGQSYRDARTKRGKKSAFTEEVQTKKKKKMEKKKKTKKNE